MPEGDWNSRLLKELKATGLFAKKTADRYQKGLPDIYVPGGIWIEGKVHLLRSRVSKTRPPRLTDGVTGMQRDTMEHFTLHGDMCFLAIYAERPDSTLTMPSPERYLAIVPYIYALSNHSVDAEWFAHWSMDFRRPKWEMIGEMFGPQYEGNWNQEWFDKAYPGWRKIQNVWTKAAQDAGLSRAADAAQDAG